MQDGSDARELLRASATDADAVQQYLQSIDADELNGLLDGIAPRERKAKQKAQQKKSEYLVQDDWLPLVHLLVHCDTTRLRAATRIIQLLRCGAPSELESMQLLTEINLGYASALDELSEYNKQQPRAQHAVRRHKLVEEIELVLEIVFQFLGEVVGEAQPANAKVLPQLLGLVPYFLGMVAEIASTSTREGVDGTDSAIGENLEKLLELPWCVQTVPCLLDVLVENARLMSRERWQLLQENVERMVTTSPEMPSETMNPIIRECIFVANVTSDAKWVGIARYLLRQLPLHLRQEAEFNLQMSFHQSQGAVSLVCESIRHSELAEDDGDDVSMETVSEEERPRSSDAARLAPDWRDVVLLLHALQASKPILHHRTSSSRVATEASLFSDIETLVWWVVEHDVKEFSASLSSTTLPRAAEKKLEKHVNELVEQLLNFGGKQIHAREWKALLLMDVAFFWIEQAGDLVRKGDQDAVSKRALAQLVLQGIFRATPETRSELLSCVFERTQRPAQREITRDMLDQLFTSQSGKLFPHLNAIQDWLSLQFQSSFGSAHEYFLIASRLATSYKDLYNFLMVFLRKLLSTGNRSHQQFAVDMWCTWLDHRLPFSEQQEEEIISALKNSMLVCQSIQAWSFGRLEQVLCPGATGEERATVSLRKTSWEELHRFLSHEVGKFIQSTTDTVEYGRSDDAEADSEDEYGDQHRRLSRYRFCALDVLYRQSGSLDGAATIGLVFQKVISCWFAFERAALRTKTSADGLTIESCTGNDGEIKRWLVDLVSNWKFFFHWICQGTDDEVESSSQSTVRGNSFDKSVTWGLLARIYIGCALCNVAIEMLMWGERTHSSRDVPQWVRAVENAELSIWSLMEVEFCLHRMTRKLAAQCASQTEGSLSKEHLNAVSYGLYRVLQPEKVHILNSIKNALHGDSATALRARKSRGDDSQADGMSFDAALFALDACFRALGDEDRYSTFFPQDREVDGTNQCLAVLETLLLVYFSVRDRVLVEASKKSTREGADTAKSGEESCKGASTTSGIVFSVYSDSIIAKFPRSVRHLLSPTKFAKAVVLLDMKSGEEILGHVCGAIERAAMMMVKIAGADRADEQLRRVLRRVSRIGQHQTRSPAHDKSNSFVSLAHYLLGDVKQSIQLDGLSKLGVSCATLSKHLGDIGADMMDEDAVSSEWHPLSALAYDVMCDNVVYHVRLLRLLLSICLPTHFADSITTFVSMREKVEGLIQACGLLPEVSDEEDKRMSSARQLGGRKKPLTPRRRRRLRQECESRSSSDVDAESESASNDESDANSRSSSDEDSSSVKDIITSPSSQTQIPHLDSQANQNAAMLAILTVLEQSLMTLLKAIPTKRRASEASTFFHHEEIIQYVRIHDSVNQAICSSCDFSWGSRRVLLKVFHMIEMNLRVGKLAGALGKASVSDVGETHDAAMELFEASVRGALRSRTWIDNIKEASQDSATKTRVSATSLKIDIFLLQVPGIVQTMTSKGALNDLWTQRVKKLVASVKEKIASADRSIRHRGKAKARQRLFGVVPIVRKRRKRLRSRHPIIDAFLNEEDGADAYADLEDFIE